MGKSQAIKIVKKFVKALRHEGISVDRVILYGSCVTGEGRPESDIDVAIVSKDFGKDRVEEGMTLYKIAGKIWGKMTLVDTKVGLKYKRRRCQNGKDSQSDLHEGASRRSSEAGNRRWNEHTGGGA